MQIILLSGGAGKRLWPLSNDLYSKQFLRLLRRADGMRESMIQRVCRQVREVAPDVSVTIATAREQTSLIRCQLGTQVDISIEPCRRDTLPAIALVCAYLHEVRGVPLEEAVAVCPADPYVEPDYFRAVTELLAVAEREGAARLFLMGIEPTYPSEKYGYILPASKAAESRVKSFRESRRRLPRRSTSRRERFGTAAYSPFVSAMPWKRRRRFFPFTAMRSFSAATRICRRSASIMPWSKRSRASPSGATAARGWMSAHGIRSRR